MPLHDVLLVIIVTAITVILSNLALAVLIGVIISALIFSWESAKRIRAKKYIDDAGAKHYDLFGPLFFASTAVFLEKFDVKNEIEKVSDHHFTTVLANLYRDEKDSNGWHADNERELGRDPIIASVSFGEERKFQLKHTTQQNIKLNLNLNHGSLLLMKEGSQIHYKHQIPKASSSKKQRINLTFRTIL